MLLIVSDGLAVVSPFEDLVALLLVVHYNRINYDNSGAYIFCQIVLLQ